jgi:hypothetical protein
MDLFSSADQKEVRKQIYDAVRLLMPGKKKQEQLVDDILRRTHPVRRADAQAEINFGLPESIFRQGGTYLDAIDPSNKAKARARGITGFSGFTSEEGINIGNRWKSKNYYKTTPFHEAVHFLVKANEYQAYTANFYYALKRGIMSESYLQRAKLANEPAKQARKKAIELFKIGSSENWRKANGLLRKEVVQK